ncbi:MAG: hypothetical protein COA79_21995 [Planctomycetota bacterium]|nr:MAG: hypothetical protein COA79_21995 [Planctomycetota bacterium]
MLSKFFKLLKESILLQCWVILLLFIVLMCFVPISNGYGRLFFVITIPAFWASSIYMLKNYKIIATVLFGLGIAFILFLILPGSESKNKSLRVSYINSLKSYEGTKYIWGGENRIGIDCSGLVRNGLINANIKQSFLTFNPKLFRNAFKLWWYDCSAKAIRDGYKNFANHKFKAKTINDIDTSKLNIGDIAVTTGGSHILAYIGNNKWIEADPGIRKTVIIKTPSKNPWFNMPIYILEWSQFTENNIK